ncbi:MAG: PLP-dependent aminotransferase family protein [Bacillota bacterium]
MKDIWKSISVSRDNTKPIYQQVYNQIKSLILDKRLPENSQLPAIRKMAEILEINPATVVKAYQALAEEEYIYKKVGSGSFVAPIQDDGLSYRTDKEEDSLEMLGYGQIEINEDINFASATPSSSLFPVEDFKQAINHVLDRDKGEAFTYQRSQGFFPLRESIQKYFNKNGMSISVNEIQIVSGAQQAIDLLVKIFLDYGDSVLIEEPTYPGAISAFKSRAAEIDTLPTLEDGIDLKLLENMLSKKNYRLLFTMTSFQNPTGICWSEAKKKRLIELAEQYNLIIIEDDCLSELAYDNNSHLPLKAYDRTGQVIYIKSFSKIFMPGLRLAFLTLPDKYRSKLLAAKHATDISTAGLTQRAMDYYFREGLWEKHLVRIKKLFHERYQLMLNQIKEKLIPPVELVYEPNGGIYFWLKLPAGISAEDFYLAARESKVALLPGDIFKLKDNSNQDNYFRLSFAAVSETEIKTGINRLKKILDNIGSENESKGYIPLV